MRYSMCDFSSNAYKEDNFRNLLVYHQNADVNFLPWLFSLKMFFYNLFYFVLSFYLCYLKVQIMTLNLPEMKKPTGIWVPIDYQAWL